LSLTLLNSNPTFLVSSVEPFNLFKISSTCLADINALASKVSKNPLSFLILSSNPPFVASNSFLYSLIGFLRFVAIPTN